MKYQNWSSRQYSSWNVGSWTQCSGAYILSSNVWTLWSIWSAGTHSSSDFTYWDEWLANTYINNKSSFVQLF